jgi:hypothetical protein
LRPLFVLLDIKVRGHGEISQVAGALKALSPCTEPPDPSDEQSAEYRYDENRD